MSGPLIIRGSVSVPEAELLWRFSRSSGPGGQHVNTTDSRVELRFNLAATDALPPVWKQRALERLADRLTSDGLLAVTASEHRSQWRNREAAATRLTALLTQATAPPPKARRPTKIPRGINERRLRVKKQRSQTKRGRNGAGWD